MLFKSVGQIRIHRESWLAVHACTDLGRYYRKGFNWIHRFENFKIGDTKWGPHISIVRSEPSTNIDFLQTLHETEIEFEYEPVYRTNGRHVWFNVFCERAFEIRKTLLLPEPPIFNLHLTLGVYHREHENDMTQLTLIDTI